MAQETSSDEQTQLQLTEPTFDMSKLSVVDERTLEEEEYKDFTTPSSWAVLRLPRFILLKAGNGNYLRSRRSANNEANSEFTAESPMDATVFEVVTLSDGAVGIRSTFYDRFLRLGEYDWSIQATSIAAFLGFWFSRFWPVKLGRGTDSNLIGLRLFMARGQEFICYRSDTDQTLRGWGMWADKNSGFVVEEPVSRRQIYGVQYHMQDAKISDHEPLTSVTKDVKNWSISPQKGVLSFSHTESESHTWGSTDSWKVSASVGISVRIPFVGKTDVTTEAYYAGSYEWGESQETAKQIGTQLEVEVPPMSMVQATMIVQKGKLEVPFSYGQTDALYDGNSSNSNFPDGVFTGVNTYVTFQTIKRSLP